MTRRLTLRDLRRSGIAYELQGTAMACHQPMPVPAPETEMRPEPGGLKVAIESVAWRIIIPGRPVPHKQFGTAAWREQYQPYLARIRQALWLLLMIGKYPIPLAPLARLEWKAYLYQGRKPDRTNITKALEDALRGTIIPDDAPKYLTAHTTGELFEAEGPEDERLEVTVWAA